MSKVIKPLSPTEVEEQVKTAQGQVPEVIEAANELIVKHWSGRSARVTLKELGALARSKLNMDSKDQFPDGALDIEEAFRKNGWSVEFDKPGYCESYDAFFVFTKKRSS